MSDHVMEVWSLDDGPWLGEEDFHAAVLAAAPPAYQGGTVEERWEAYGSHWHLVTGREPSEEDVARLPEAFRRAFYVFPPPGLGEMTREDARLMAADLRAEPGTGRSRDRSLRVAEYLEALYDGRRVGMEQYLSATAEITRLRREVASLTDQLGALKGGASAEHYLELRGEVVAALPEKERPLGGLSHADAVRHAARLGELLQKVEREKVALAARYEVALDSIATELDVEQPRHASAAARKVLQMLLLEREADR